MLLLFMESFLKVRLVEETFSSDDMLHQNEDLHSSIFDKAFHSQL